MMYVLDHEYFIVKGGGPSLQRMGVLRRPLVFEKKWGAEKEERMALGRLSRKKVHMHNRSNYSSSFADTLRIVSFGTASAD
jgi:hypothetical protein